MFRAGPSPSSRAHIVRHSLWEAPMPKIPLLLLAAAALAGCGGVAPSTTTEESSVVAPPIKHVVVIVKENHTSDNYFGSFPGAEGTSTCQTSTGPIACPHAPDSTSRDLCHAHSCALTAWNGGAMNGWDGVSGTSVNGDNLA